MTHSPFVTIGPGYSIPWRYLTRHIGIFGATGTGKTTTVAAIAERAADAGIPVLVFDAKGDMESLATATGGDVWDMDGLRGPIRRLDLATLGPEGLALALGLSEAQAGAMELAHALAKDLGLPLSTVDDLRTVLRHIEAGQGAGLGYVTPATVGAILRSLLRLDRAAPKAIGTPGLDPFQAHARDKDGRGLVSVVRAAPYTATPGLYSAAVLSTLGTLYREAPELGDVDAPALMVVIDESHLVFDGAPVEIVRQLESIVRLIRSKGISLVFASQAPGDFPDGIGAQLVTRIQHALRGNTPKAQSAIRAAAMSMPTGARWQDVADTIRGLGTGQALVSVPDAQGTPCPAKVCQVQPGKIQPSPAPMLATPHTEPAPVVEIEQEAPKPRRTWPRIKAPSWWETLPPSLKGACKTAALVFLIFYGPVIVLG